MSLALHSNPTRGRWRPDGAGELPGGFVPDDAGLGDSPIRRGPMKVAARGIGNGKTGCR